MRLRLAGTAFFVGVLSTFIVWLALQPSLVRLFEAGRALAPGSPGAEALLRARSLLPFALGAGMLLVSLAVYFVLQFSVERPLKQAAASVEALGSLEDTLSEPGTRGPLLHRLDQALRRSVMALREERQLTLRQLEELRLANEELRRAQLELVTAERLATVGRLAAGVAHEVGNPLAGILGYLSIVRGRLPPEHAVQDFLNRIEAEVLRIDGIVRGLLDLGRPLKGASQPIPARPLVENVMQLVVAGPELRGITYRVDVPDELLLRAESGPLAQVLLNLLLNAAQAMGGAGEVRVRGRAEGTEGVLDVEDDGPGLPENVQARLFEPFFTTKAAGKGTGLGLAVSHHLVTALGGRLSAENLPGKGARFTLRLPLGSRTI